MVKNYFYIILFLLLFISNSISAQTTAIPDVNFEQYLIDKGIDTDGVINHYVATSDISGVTSVDLTMLGIKDLTGIENFISLKSLLCAFNEITNLDVNQLTSLQDLWCEGNSITILNVNGATALKSIDCASNQLTTLDVSQNLNLQSLSCWENQLTTLDLNNNTQLQYLFCLVNQLTSLNVSQNINLQILDCRGNPTLTCIQVDDEDAANAGIAPYDNWEKDNIAVYSEDCSTLSINDELLAQSISLYPNPVSNTLTIYSEIPLIKVEIYSILGKKIKDVNSNFSDINIGNLSAGLYLTKIYSEKGGTFRKIIKN